MEVNIKEFRQILEKDGMFTDYINAFLNLPIFSRRFAYSQKSHAFIVEPSTDSKIYTVDEDCILNWICTCRLPLFFKSELFYEYKFCRALNHQNEVLQGPGNGSSALSSVVALYDFKKFLFQTDGEVLYLFWMDVEHLKCHQSYFYTRKLIIRIGNTYIADGSPLRLPDTLKEKLTSVEKMDEPQNRWNTKQQVKELVQCQSQAMETLREYWSQKYVLKLEEDGKLMEKDASDEDLLEYSEIGSQDSEEAVLLRPSSRNHPLLAGRQTRKTVEDVRGDQQKKESVSYRLSRSPPSMTFRPPTAERQTRKSAENVKGSQQKKESTSHMGYLPISRSLTIEKAAKGDTSELKSTTEHLPAVVSSDSLSTEDGTKKASHIKISTSKIPLLFTGEKKLVANATSNDTFANNTMNTIMEPDDLISSSMYSLLSESSSSLLRFDLREEISDSVHLEPFLCAALRADFTTGNPFLRFLKVVKRSADAVNYMLFWQSVENILTQDEMRRWYTSWCVQNLENEDDKPSPYLSYFEPYVVAKNLQELCLFFLQPKSLHKVRLPEDMEQQLGLLLPRGLGQGLLLAAQEYAAQNLISFWKEYLLSDYERFLANCTAEKFKRKSTEHLQSMTEGSVLMENVYMSGDLEIMWRALKHSEAIKYAGIHQLPSRNPTQSSIHKLCSEVPPTSTTLPPTHHYDDEIEAWIKQHEGVNPNADLCPLMTTLYDQMDWDMKRHKHTRRLYYSIRPMQFNFGSSRKIYPPKNMMTILRDREHLEYFRNFISSQGETGEGVEAPLQFWLAVEDLKNNIHNSSMYNYKVKKIRERFLDGRPYKLFRGTLLDDKDKKPGSKGDNTDLFKLITAQATIRLSLEKKWLPEYLDFLEKEEEKKRDQERKWEEEKRERLRKRKEREKASVKKQFWQNLTHTVASFKKDLMNPTVSLLFQKYLYDEVVQCAKSEAKRIVTTPSGKPVNARKLLRDLGFWAEVERYKDLVRMVKSGEKLKHKHTPEDYIMVHKKAHAIANCYMDSTIQPKIQVNVKEDTVQDILERLSKGDITYNLFHRASMETFHILFTYWRKFSVYRTTPRESSRPQNYAASKRDIKRMAANTSLHRDFYDSGGPILSFSLVHGLHWFYPGLAHPVPVTYHCDIMPNCPSYPTLKQIMRMPEVQRVATAR